MGLSDEQKLFVKTCNKNILVSASAGSGKTFSMIKKLSHILTTYRIPITKLLVVTYTNSAGSELKTKLYNELYDVLYNTNDTSLKDYLKNQLDNINNVDIGTIHAICRKIIIKYFYELEISPDFRLLSEKERKYFLELCTKDVFEKHIICGDEDFYNLYLCYDGKRNDANLKSIVFKLFNYINSLSDYKMWFNNFLNSSYNKDLTKNNACEYILNYTKNMLLDLKPTYINLKNLSLDNFKNYSIFLDTINNFIDSFSESKDVIQAIKICNSMDLPQKPRLVKNADVILSDYDNEIKQFNDKFKEIINNFKIYMFLDDFDSLSVNLDKAKNNIIKLFEIVEEIKSLFNKMKRDRNCLDFNDLEDYMLLLLENEKIKETLKQSYDYVFVDEYQDVNEKQESIISKLVNGNNYNMIGDVKQSIYKFRNSTPKIFLQKYNDFQLQNMNNSVIKFNLNFRSDRNILFFANSIFNGLITKNTIGIDYKKDANFESKRNFKNNRVFLDVLNVDSSYKEKESAEALIIANNIAKILKMKNDDGKFYSYSDIAIIIRNRGNFLKTIVKKFNELNIPVSATFNNSFFETSEIVFLIAILKVISNYKDDISIAIVLKNLFNLSEEELYKIKKSSNLSNFYECVCNYNNQDNIKSKIDLFFEFVSNSKIELMEKSIYEFLSDTIDKYDIIMNYKSYPNGEEKESNILDFLSLADNETYKYNVDKFLDYLDFISKESSSQIIGSGGDAVKITTIHSSKGLEYPVVIFSGLGKELLINKDKNNIIISDEFGVGLKAINSIDRTMSETVVRYACELGNRKSEIDEEIRLLYVALTRAKDYLFLTGVYDLDNIEKRLQKNIYNTKTYFDMILRTLSDKDIAKFSSSNNFNIFKDDGVCVVNILYTKDINLVDDKIDDVILNTIDENLKNKLLSVYDKKPINKVNVIKNTVTNILNEEKDYELINYNPKNLDYTDKNEEKDYLKIGTAYHSIMQYLKFTETDAEVKILADELCEKNIINVDILKYVNLDEILRCRDVLSPLILKSKKCFREKQFLLRENYNKLVKNSDNNTKVIVQGVIDLVIQFDDYAILIDYKTNRTANEEYLKDLYGVQLDIYKKAFEKATNIDIKEKYLYSFYLGKLIKLD